MGWERHNGKSESAAKKNTVRTAIRYDGKGHYALKISIGRDVLKRLGLSATAPVDFFWGEGAHQGWVRMAHTTTGHYALSLHHSAQGEKASLALVVGGLPNWIIREKMPIRETRFTINLDGELEIKLPQEFLTNTHRRKTETVEYLSTSSVGEKGLTARLNGNAGV